MGPLLDFLVKEKPWKHTMRALNTKRRDGLMFAWRMARASYEYSRSHGLTRLEALVGALELFWEKAVTAQEA